MTFVSIPDFDQAKQNTDFIEEFANSESETALDRLGRARKTLAGVEAYIGEHGILAQTLGAQGATEAARDQAQSAAASALAVGKLRTSVAQALADDTIPDASGFTVPLADGTLQSYIKESSTVASPVGQPFANRGLIVEGDADQ